MSDGEMDRWDRYMVELMRGLGRGGRERSEGHLESRLDSGVLVLTAEGRESERKLDNR